MFRVWRLLVLSVIIYFFGFVEIWIFVFWSGFSVSGSFMRGCYRGSGVVVVFLFIFFRML